MGKDTGFLEFDKESPPLRPVDERVRDFQEYGTFLSWLLDTSDADDE